MKKALRIALWVIIVWFAAGAIYDALHMDLVTAAVLVALTAGLIKAVKSERLKDKASTS